MAWKQRDWLEKYMIQEVKWWQAYIWHLEELFSNSSWTQNSTKPYMCAEMPFFDCLTYSYFVWGSCLER